MNLFNCRGGLCPENGAFFYTLIDIIVLYHKKTLYSTQHVDNIPVSQPDVARGLVPIWSPPFRVENFGSSPAKNLRRIIAFGETLGRNLRVRPRWKRWQESSSMSFLRHPAGGLPKGEKSSPLARPRQRRWRQRRWQESSSMSFLRKQESSQSFLDSVSAAKAGQASTE